ncbi:MAG: hypothetical protein ABSD10_02235 [Candidatus Saccharimonadales bacterium]|jgi:hypothetical protein
MAYGDEDRVFDVSKPHKTSPSATSKPIIVGHHPIMNDPMVTKDRLDEPAHLKQSPEPTHVLISVEDNNEPSAMPLLQHSDDVAQLKTPLLEDSKGSPSLPAESAEESQPAEMPVHGEPAAIYSQNETVQPDSAEPQPVHEEADLAAPGTPMADEPQPDSGAPFSDLPLSSHHGSQTSKGRRKKWLWILIILIVLAGVYALLDAKTSVSLPFYLLRKTTPAQTPSSVPVTTAPSTGTPSSLPDGFTAYSLSSTGVSFDYPTTWGTPSITTDPGFSKRGGANQSDGAYAYLVSFVTNKGVQLAFTSSKYLPAARAALYYDYLKWCTGTNDNKFYKSVMHFTTNDGVDTPSTITCDQGPLADASTVNSSTIVELNTQAPDGTALGDLYTKNLTNTSLPVVRVKDTAMSNGNLIKTLLGTITVAASTSSTSSQQ